MKERGILFSGEMVKAILENRKVQTRRLVDSKTGPDFVQIRGRGPLFDPRIDAHQVQMLERCPHGFAWDRLWVRETWTPFSDGSARVLYAADAPARSDEWEKWRTQGEERWRPSIFMPRESSRITLELTGVRVERLQAITEEDAKAEGVPVSRRAPMPGEDPHRGPCVNCGKQRSQHVGSVHACPGVSGGHIFSSASYRGGFAYLWDAINGKRFPWKTNPFCWVLSFRRLESA